jgi:hypothetical protein
VPHWPGRPVTADWRYPDPRRTSLIRSARAELAAGAASMSHPLLSGTCSCLV